MRVCRTNLRLHRLSPSTHVMTRVTCFQGIKSLYIKRTGLSTANEAISFQVSCATQEELDYYWEKLAAGGDEKTQQCGWLKDKYGVSWQVVPTVLVEMITDPDPKKSERAMAAMLQMKKLDIDKLKRAYAG